MKKMLLAAMVSSAVLLSACSTLPSKPRTFNQLGQFSSYPLNAQSFRISFKTDRDINYGMAEEITLVKAAQTTVKNGFRYFKVVNDPSNRTQHPPRQTVVYSAPPPMFYPYGPYRASPFAYDPFYRMPQVVTLEPTEVSYTIECFKDQKKRPEDAFDATLILKSLGAKYGLTPFGDILEPQTSTTPQTRTAQ
ncbi:CC0125/CC1285 family lipoprotein [Acinetobacter sp. MD2(2019)]|uniref:CC0125/CC1285 family lipoprotein n=1 Tax=Acinetobacter sp. MD2(2019) TaxID=2605273 RepID=UPI002D1EA99B|nr:hypothetical protein [Acinetobacter sp. MD2(2019)]MEB3754924.1 hypothetical protein [Acinetobacter sp. MD2(2019)]